MHIVGALEDEAALQAHYQCLEVGLSGFSDLSQKENKQSRICILWKSNTNICLAAETIADGRKYHDQYRLI